MKDFKARGWTKEPFFNPGINPVKTASEPVKTHASNEGEPRVKKAKVGYGKKDNTEENCDCETNKTMGKETNMRTTAALY